MTPVGEHWRTRTEAARLFGVHPNTIAACVKRGELVGRPYGRVWCPPGAIIADRRNGQALEQSKAEA